MYGKCPVCGETKDITEQGKRSGQCDDCYTKKYTCFECNEMVTDAWDLRSVEGKGNAHSKCLNGGH